FPARQFLVWQRLEEHCRDPALEKPGPSLPGGAHRHQLDVRLAGLRENNLLPAVNPVEDPGEVRLGFVDIDQRSNRHNPWTKLNKAIMEPARARLEYTSQGARSYSADPTSARRRTCSTGR